MKKIMNLEISFTDAVWLQTQI